MGNLSLQCVNSMNHIVKNRGGYGWPMTHSMFGLDLALQWHPWAVQVHGNKVNLVYFILFCFSLCY
jgi:hypothetical protein